MRIPNVSARPPVDTLTTLRVIPGRCHFSAFRNVSVTVWVGQADGPTLEGLIEVTKGMAARNPSGYSAVHFILDGLPGPTPDAQPLLTRALAPKPELSCVAVVLEGEGFWASGLRSMLNNSHRQAGSGIKLRIGTSIDPLLEWLIEEHQGDTGVAFDPNQLREALKNARAAGELAARL